MSTSHHSEVGGYVQPSPEEITAQKKRNLAIAFSLAGFSILSVVLMLYKLGLIG